MINFKVVALVGVIAVNSNTSATENMNITTDLTVPSNVSCEVLQESLYYELSDISEAFVFCEEQYGVNAVALSSIAALESGWGRSELAQTKNNLFGWRNNDGDYMYFETKEDCVEHVAEFLSVNYLSEDGKFYNDGTEIEDIASFYSESSEWKNLVEDIFYQIKDRCENETK